MPTWRDKDQDFLNTALPDFDLLSSSLEKNDLVMYIKLHPNTKTIKRKDSNIIFIDPLVDVYDFLPNSDLLITDYSSIYFDYLLMNKEIIFYPFDYENYNRTDREFYFNYNAFTPGKKVYNFGDLLKILNNLYTLNYTKERKILKDDLWKYQDGNASKRIFDHFDKE